MFRESGAGIRIISFLADSFRFAKTTIDSVWLGGIPEKVMVRIVQLDTVARAEEKSTGS